MTTATGKFYTNGLDTTWIFGNLDGLPGYLDKVHTIYSRLLTFPMATVAAVQGGHAFGAGAMLASSHDFQSHARGPRLLLPAEVGLNMPFTVGMSALLNSRLPKQTAVDAMTTGGVASAVPTHLLRASCRKRSTATECSPLLWPSVGTDVDSRQELGGNQGRHPPRCSCRPRSGD